MDSETLQILIQLAETGIAECPWAWADDFPWTLEQSEEALAKLRSYSEST